MFSDREAIENLLEEYCWRVDHREWDAWLACFTADGVFAVRGQELRGHEAIRAYVEHSVGDYRLLRHLLYHPSVQLRDAPRATARAYFEVRGVTARGQDVNALGSYEDDLLKTEAGWQFKRRLVHFDYFSRRDEPWLRGGDV
jgi:SnoaL-like domain